MTELHMTGYVPGVIGRVVELHASYYAEHWGFDRRFEIMVAQGFSDFLADFDEERDGFWAAIQDGVFAGSISIHGRDAGEEGAKLRYFITNPKLQGRGVGTRLMDEAMAFCDQAGFARVHLWTFAGLDAARHLYERYGFRLCQERQGDQWGTLVNEQMFERLS